MNKIKGGLIALFSTFLLLFAAACTTQVQYSQEQLDSAVKGAVDEENTASSFKIKELEDKISALEKAKEEVPVVEAETPVEELVIEVEAPPIEEVPAPIQEVVVNDYLIGELSIGDSIDKVLSDRQVKNLFDGKVTFDNEEYDAEESITLSGLKLESNEADYGSNVYLTIPAGGVEYAFEVESEFDTSLVTEDETVKFNLLGEAVEISNWDSDEITFTKGKEYLLNEGGSVQIGNKTVAIEFVLENSIYVTVDGIGEKIYEGTTENVNGLDVRATEVLYQSGEFGKRKAVIEVGEEVETSVSDGDDYSKDSIWEWKITSSSIGLVLNEEFVRVDEDEEFKALTSGDSLSLPNNYVSVKYNGLSEEKTENVRFDLTSKNGFDFTRVKGNFFSGLKDYNRVLVNSTGIYDDELVLIGSEVQIGDSDLSLELVGTNLTVDDVKVALPLTSIIVGSVDISSKDDDYITNFGVIVKNPEDYLDDFKVELVVPEEKLEGSVSVRA